MSTCRSCSAAIVWMRTAAGKNMPVDYNEVAARDAEDGETFDPENEDHVSHFGTCPQSRQWSKKREHDAEALAEEEDEQTYGEGAKYWRSR